MNEQPSNASAFIKVRVLDWVLFTLFIMQTSLFPMFNGCALVNDKAAKDPAVIAALSPYKDVDGLVHLDSVSFPFNYIVLTTT